VKIDLVAEDKISVIFRQNDDFAYFTQNEKKMYINMKTFGLNE